MAESQSQAKERLQSIGRHLTAEKGIAEGRGRPKLELEDHTIDAVRSLKVSLCSMTGVESVC